MQIDQRTLLDALRQRGEQDKATQAERELPDQVDTDQHGELLRRFGLDPQELLQRFWGGGAPQQ